MSIIYGAYQVSKGFTQIDGSILVYEQTNDNEDKGYPNEYAEWTRNCKDRAEFDRKIGKSRRGVSGVEVLVFLDGEKLL